MSIESHLGDIASLFTCTPGTPGRLSEHFTRIATPFLFPDGDVLDLYYREEAGIHLLTDWGATLRWLKDQWAEQSLPASVRGLLPGICQAQRVELSSGCLKIRVSQESEIALALMRLAQTAMRIADLWFVLYGPPAPVPPHSEEEGHPRL